MDNLIDKLWHGKLCPNEDYVKEYPEYFDALEKIIAAQRKFTKTLSKNQKDAFFEYNKSQGIYESAVESVVFKHAFKLGVNLMHQCIDTSSFKIEFDDGVTY